MGDSNENEFLDEEIIAWIEANKENLQPLYESYLEGLDGASCTFEEFATYYFYESGH